MNGAIRSLASVPASVGMPAVDDEQPIVRGDVAASRVTVSTSDLPGGDVGGLSSC
ncbi:MAG: hypothetical protein V3V08_22715 [Nannocystaceae bacterium]